MQVFGRLRTLCPLLRALSISLLCILTLQACTDDDGGSLNTGIAPNSSALETKPEVTRISLVEAAAWDFQSKSRDTFSDHRPRIVDCQRDVGWVIEDDEIEVRTDSCNYLSLTQESLLNIPAGNTLEFAISHGDLVFRQTATAHVALSVAGNTLWEQEIGIPSEGEIYRIEVELDFDIAQRDSIEVHLHNHGSNAWTIHRLEAIVTGEFNLDEFCPTYESTFEAIQATVFEQSGCASSQCHSSETLAGGLDLTADLAYNNLIDVPALSSQDLLIDPRNPHSSYLYQKLAAKTEPGSFAIAGSPMPAGGPGISTGQLEAIRLWIEAGAPETGSVGDTLGRGEDELERLLGVCLPEPQAVKVRALAKPAADEGVQFKMPPHEIRAEHERELCFAVYEDFREQIPAEHQDATGNLLYYKADEQRSDPYTHHNVLMYAGVPLADIHDESFGEWTCAGGEFDSEVCEPTDTASCGSAGQCRSEIKDSIACQGYGPASGRVGANDEVNRFSVRAAPDQDGFYEEMPSHGIFFWNSHSFNLTTEDVMHNVWHNVYFSDDRRFKSERVTNSTHIFAGAGTQPFTRKEVCREHVFDQGDALLSVSSHTHKRGEKFTIAFKGGEESPFYINTNYDEPLLLPFNPPWEFNSADPDDRTLVYCGVYNNGLNPDDSMNLDTVTRASRKPPRSYCSPNACIAGQVGAPCSGREDHASCDSEPGAGDGFCDACPISAGITSDDEMFILLAQKASDYANQIANAPSSFSITRPGEGAQFEAGDTFTVELDMRNFSLMPPEGHAHQSADHAAMNADAGDHSTVKMGHYHIYLDTDDDAADHVTDWSPILEYTLPADIEPGEHYLRINLRAPDHHALDIEQRLDFTVK
jgi:hypothetical protein